MTSRSASATGCPRINVMNTDGTMNANAGPFAGMPIAAARSAVVERLQRGRPAGRHRAARARGRPLPALRHGRRAVDLDAVVRAHGGAGAAGDRGGQGRQSAVRAGAFPRRLPQLAGEHPRLDASRASSGGGTASRSGTASSAARRSSPKRRRSPPARTAADRSSRTPTCSTPGSPPDSGRSRPWAGRTTPRTCAATTRPR